MPRPGLCRIGVRRRSLKPVERAFCEIRVEYPRGIVRSPRSPTNAYQPVGREWWIGLPDRRRGAETTVRRQRTTLFRTTETPLRKPYHPQISGLEKAPTMPHR
jgi:hypothetical protein